MTKGKKITLIVVSCIFAFLGIVVLFWYFGDVYPQFYKYATKEFEICGLREKFVPQGMCYEKENDVFIYCGYMSNDSASRVYVYDGKETKFVTLKSGTKVYAGHSGGIATDGKSVWLVGGGEVNRFSFSDLLEAENNAQIEILDSFKSNNGADFVTIENNHLWLGEFHRDGKYDTDESHNIKNNKALSFCYEIDETQPYAIKSTTPLCALSTPSLVQGLEFYKDKIILSTSYSLPNSNIYFYNNIITSTTEKFKYENTEIDLYILEADDLEKTINLPCMSEEIVVKEDSLYVLFENACQKYGAFTREQLRNVYSLDLEEILN